MGACMTEEYGARLFVVWQPRLTLCYTYLRASSQACGLISGLRVRDHAAEGRLRQRQRRPRLRGGAAARGARRRGVLVRAVLLQRDLHGDRLPARCEKYLKNVSKQITVRIIW